MRPADLHRPRIWGAEKLAGTFGPPHSLPFFSLGAGVGKVKYLQLRST
jgi:hypothetical protein